MKKIRLKVANLDGTEILSREQLKRVFGGIAYTCIRAKGYESTTVFFSEASTNTIAAWESVWHALGWTTECWTMPVTPGGSGSGGTYYV